MTDTMGAYAPDAYAEDEGGRDKKTLLVAGGLAALVLGAGAFFFLGGSDAETTQISAPSSSSAQLRAKAAAAREAAAAAAKAKAKAPAVVPAQATFNVGRNPFTALYVAPEAAVAATPKAPATTPVTTPVTTVPTTGGTTYIPPVTTTVPKPTTPAVVLHKLVLKTVSAGSGTTKTMGTFVIDKKKYVVPVGQVFGPKSELVVVAYQQDAKGVWTAVLRVGDSAPFDAVQGDELNVM